LPQQRQLLSQLRQDVQFHYEVANRRPPGPLPLLILTNPSIRAVALMRLAASSTGFSYTLWRNLLMALHGCDVASGAIIIGPIDCPHPVGIVFGTGVRVGAGVRIFQHVTLGQSRAGGYPEVNDHTTLYSGSVVAGDVTVGPRAVIGANVVVTADVPRDSVARGVRR
jgi:serine O-acetyltransferase